MEYPSAKHAYSYGRANRVNYIFLLFLVNTYDVDTAELRVYTFGVATYCTWHSICIYPSRYGSSVLLSHLETWEKEREEVETLSAMAYLSMQHMH